MFAIRSTLFAMLIICPGIKFKMGRQVTRRPCGIQAMSYTRYINNFNSSSVQKSCCVGIQALLEARVYQKCGRFIPDDELVVMGGKDKELAHLMKLQTQKSAWAHAVITHTAKATGLQRTIVRGIAPEATIAICYGLVVSV